MDIYSYLKKDHKKVSDLMDQVLASRSAVKRKSLFDEIRHELLLHAETENATFYKALKDKEETEENIEHAEEEHDEIKSYIGKLGKLPVDSEKWIEQFGEFRHSVTHHVDEEEGDIFEKARKILSKKQAEDLAAQMDALKHKKMKAAA